MGVERQTELPEFQRSSDGFDAVLRHADGREKGGLADRLRRGPQRSAPWPDAPFPGETLKSDWMLADIHMTGCPWHDNEVSIYWHRDGVLVVPRRAALLLGVTLLSLQAACLDSTCLK